MTDDTRPDDAIDDFDPTQIEPAQGYDQISAFEQEVERLAALPEVVFERTVKEEAQALGVGVVFLRKVVKRARPKDDTDEGGQGKAISFVDFTPSDEPVDGAKLLDDLSGQLERFICAPQAAFDATSLWIVHAHAFEAWWVSPKLWLRSVAPREGKSRMMELLSRLCPKALLAADVSASALFRMIEQAQPTVLLDEADDLTKRDDRIRRLINAGHTRASANVVLSVPCGDGWDPRVFDVWTPLALAGIGSQALTITDRSVPIFMKRKPKGHRVEPLRFNQDYGFTDLGRRCARWAADHLDELREAYPKPPPGLHDRQQDSWSPLLAIADVAGSDWPHRARKAAIELHRVAEDLDEEAIAIALLFDIKQVFDTSIDDKTRKPPASRVRSALLCGALNGMADRPWCEIGKSGSPLSQYKMAIMLSEFGIASGIHRFAVELSRQQGETKPDRGYLRSQFLEAWQRYTPAPDGRPDTPAEAESVVSPPSTPLRSVTSLQPKPSAGFSDFQSVTKPENVTLRNRPKPKPSAACNDVTLQKGGEGRKHTNVADSELAELAHHAINVVGRKAVRALLDELGAANVGGIAAARRDVARERFEALIAAAANGASQ